MNKYTYIYIYIYICIYIYILSIDGLQNYPYTNNGPVQLEKEGGGDHPVTWGDGHVQLANSIEATIQFNSVRSFISIQFNVSVQFVDCTCPSPKGMAPTSLPFEWI